MCPTWNRAARDARRAIVAALLLNVLNLSFSQSDEQNSSAQPTTAFPQDVKPFLTTYCVGCHGPAKQKGERRFDLLTGDIANDDGLIDLQDILDQLNLGEMPPQDARQPSDAERQRVTGWLSARIESFQRTRKPNAEQTVLRRLNTREYRNSVRDLFVFNMTMFDPTVGFPRDQMTEHLDNIGESLVTSGHLLQSYLSAAERVVDKAFKPATRPEVQRWSFQDGFRQQPEIDQVHGRTNGFSHITLYDVIGADKHEGAYGAIARFREGVPVDGAYEITFHATALNRQHPYDREFVGTDPDEPLRLGIVAGNFRAGPLHKPQPIEPLLAELDLDDGTQTYTVRVWLDEGFTPRFTFRNGLMDARNMWGKLVRKYADQFPQPVRGGIVEHRFNAIKYGKLPQIHIDNIEISGPYYDDWPTPSQKALLGDDWSSVQQTATLTDDQVRKHLTELASRAYRRPAESDEIERLVQLFTTRKASGRSPIDAYADAVKSILCSPAFLYLDPGDEKVLTSHALASRLSYFLWSSMPDRELFELARSGQLQTPQVLREQIQRMLKDPRSDSLIDGILDGWLTLRDLGSMPPDRSKFNDYYRHDLQEAMRRETWLFTRKLLDDNLTVLNFLDANFTYVNKPLAKMYGIDPPAGEDFELVSLNDHRRGGLLGQASILTVTANGIDTSPIVRGVWLLENILGTPPSPPPPDVPPLDPDVRGAKSIRDQLEKHRNVAACYECHRKIDPLGFALENFDAIGNWRERYEGKASIDAAGELPSGQKFSDIQGFKQILLERQEQFVTALTTKLLSYATGRRLVSIDRTPVRQIVKQLNDRGNGFRDLIELVATSEAFRAQ